MTTLRRAVITGVLYALAAQYAVFLQDVADVGAVFWPGAGITVTALLVSPRRAWPAILAAVGLAEVVTDVSAGFGAVASAWWAAANILEPLAAAWLLQRWRATSFHDVRTTLRFVAAAFLAPVLGALIGAIGTTLAASELPYLITAAQWVIGDGLGILTVAPLGLVVTRHLATYRLFSLEARLAVVAVVVTAAAVFSLQQNSLLAHSEYLLLFPMVWAAVRLRVAGAAVSSFVVAQVGNLGHAFERGPFAVLGLGSVEASAQLQLFLASVGVTVLLLATRTQESEAHSELAETRQRLVDAVSHELRSPLTPIIGYSDLLLRHYTDGHEDLRRGLEAINRNGRQMRAMVDELLQVARNRRDGLTVAPEDIDVADFVADLVADRNDTNLGVTDVPPGLACRADPTHLTQILTNLLDNAVRHGRPPVRLEVASDGEMVRFAVTDDGAGVPDWFVAHLFDDFAQAAASPEHRPTAGLGLGLPIARDLARANGGALTYEPGDQGATFAVTVPAVGRSSGRPAD